MERFPKVIMEIQETQAPTIGHSRRIRYLMAISTILIFSLFAYLSIRSKSIPSFKGRTVDEWFWGNEGHPGRARTNQEAEIAFNAMGTNCMPYLIEKARGTETRLNRWYCKLHPNLPDALRKWIRPAIPATYTQMLAVTYFCDLERHDPRIIDPFTSQLVEIAPTITNNNTRSAVFSLVEKSLGRSQDKIQSINFFLSFSDDSNFRLWLKAMTEEDPKNRARG